MTPNAYVVLTDNNPALIQAAFFGPSGEARAIAWRDANAGGAAVRPAVLSSYALIITL